MTSAGARFEYVILELSAVSHMDSSASSAVLTWIHELSHDGIQLLLAGPNASCMLTLEHANVPTVSKNAHACHSRWGFSRGFKKQTSSFLTLSLS